MSEEEPWLGQAIRQFGRPSNQLDPFNILFLPDGFMQSEKRVFEEFTNSLSREMLNIPPFDYCQSYINFFRSFWAASESGIDEFEVWDPTKTYQAGDLVTDEVYFCKSLQDGNTAPFEISPWLLVDDPGEPVQLWHVLVPYKEDEIVRWPDGSAGKFFKSKHDDNLSTKPYEFWETVARRHPKTWFFVEDIKSPLGNYMLSRSGFSQLDRFAGQLVSRVLKELTMPNNFSAPLGIDPTPSDIWFNPDNGSKSFGAVCIVVNTDLDVGAVNSAYSGGRDTDRQKPASRFCLMGIHGLESLEGSIWGGYADTFVHELAHSLNLQDEYVRIFDVHEPPQKKLIENGYIMTPENVQFSQLAPDSESFLNFLKWKRILTSEELEAFKAGNNIFTRDYLLSNFPQYFYFPQRGYQGSGRSIIPEMTDSTPDPEDALEIKNYRTVPGKDKPVYWNDVYLVEGAQYSKQSYRPNLECKMRHSNYGSGSVSSTAEQNRIINTFAYQRRGEGVDRYGSPEFCRACNFSIRKHITGFDTYVLGGPDRRGLDSLFYDELMPRLYASFKVEYGWADPHDFPIGQENAAKASTRIFIMLEQRGVQARFLINANHVSVVSRGIIMDPVLFDWYRIEDNPTGPIRYFKDRDPVPFANDILRNGFMGNRREIRNLLNNFIPLENSQVDIVSPGVSNLDDSSISREAIINGVRLLYRHTAGRGVLGFDRPWVGPERDPGRDRLDLAVNAFDQFSQQIIGNWKYWRDHPKPWRPGKVVSRDGGGDSEGTGEAEETEALPEEHTDFIKYLDMSISKEELGL